MVVGEDLLSLLEGLQGDDAGDDPEARVVDGVIVRVRLERVVHLEGRLGVEDSF